MGESQPSGWFYRLGPHLVLSTRPGPNPAVGKEQVLVVHSGRAFPPGHPSTRLCLNLLKAALAERPAPLLLDLGCGAGVLSLAAAALGVDRVVGVDLALAAVKATRKNARENGLAVQVQVAQGSSECLRGSFDLVCANLPWEVQLDKAAEFHRLAAPDGRLVLAGFRDNQEGPLLARYRDLGWSVKQRLVKDFRHPELPPDYSFTWVAWLLERAARSDSEPF